MRRLVALLLLALTATACGSTVQQAGMAGAPGAAAPMSDGLSLPLEEAAAAEGGGGVPAAGQVPESAGVAMTGAGSAAGVAAGPTPAGATAAGATGAVPGVAARPVKTGPVKVGFVNTKVGNAENAGLNVGQTYSTDRLFRALVDAMNKKGGLAGRQIVPVTADTDTASDDWNRDFQAACERLTQDDKVAVVLGYVFAFLDSFESCLAQAGVPHLSGSYTVGDVQSLRDFPTLVGASALSADRRYRLQLEGAVRSGYLTPKNKLGLLVDACPPQARAVERTVEPYIKQTRLVEAARTTFSCANGAGDVAPVASQIQAAVLQFRERGVDRVFVEGIPLILFAQAAESQGYRPGYVVTSTSGGGALEPNMPAAQAANVHGYGWMPHIDVGPANQPAKTASQQRCLSLMRSEGVIPSQYNDFHLAFTTCDGMFLYEAALQRTRGDDDVRAVIGAVTSLGTSFPGVAVHSQRTQLGPQRRDAPVVYRPWSWNGSCRCFRYTGGELQIS